MLLLNVLRSAASNEPFSNMLAYGGPRQSAALVATWGKLLRTVAMPQLLSDLGRHDTAAVDPSPPQLQLARLASYAACKWLPLACLASEGMPVLQRAPDTGDQGLYQLVQVATVALVRWLPVLAQCSEPAQGQAAAAAAAPVAPVRDVGAAEALEAGTAAAPVVDAPQRLLHAAGSSCCCGRLAGDCVRARWGVQSRCAVGGNEAAAAQLLLLLLRGGRLPGRGAAGDARCGRQGGSCGEQRSYRIPTDWMVAEAFALARQAELWAAGGGEDGAELVWVLGGAEPKIVAMAQALISCPAGARTLLRICANPACDNLAGDSVAGLPLRACGRCGGAWCCRKERLAAHWRSGHREACVARGTVAAGGIRARQAAADSSDL
ncbi:hypothetical protein TSOC_004056 [Tetrabaena socialis]|uniref:MYND-type domain-containing protein n=1 Tax=Tetrabaena socialis TaxID=47790 RepID=A0A2J8A9Y6_9CHLO|nr:hypothetical protein TSOC_004056 [Tetrabaena socialis]|eukprot:PNH09332.1 hypothetical protein TSOC_004056 [Tetrabaena socialis]